MLDEHTIDELMNEDDDLGSMIQRDNEGSEGLEPLVIIDIDDVNSQAHMHAQMIAERLSNYYFDERYIKEHPYIPTKIMMEMENIRRLLKMLLINEHAQDALIKAIAISAGKGMLYMSLTALQKTILLIQKQLNDLVTGLETIFQKMQDETEKSWAEKDKETGDDGSVTVRGSKEFIKKLQEQFANKEQTKNEEKEGTADTQKQTQEIPEGATPIEDIIG